MLGVNPRRMAGWEPETSLRPDGEGGWLLEREPEWTDDDLALLIAAREQAAGIGSHGVPMEEATSPLADPARREGYHYETRAKIDWAQRALNIAQKERAEAFPDEDAGSVLWTVVRVEDRPLRSS